MRGRYHQGLLGFGGGTVLVLGGPIHLAGHLLQLLKLGSAGAVHGCHGKLLLLLLLCGMLQSLQTLAPIAHGMACLQTSICGRGGCLPHAACAAVPDGHGTDRFITREHDVVAQTTGGRRSHVSGEMCW